MEEIMEENSPSIAKTKKLNHKSTTVKSPVTTGPGHVFSKFVSKVSVKPNKKLSVPLGNTFTGSVPKGFSIELRPRVVAAEEVELQITTSGTPQKFEYMLHVTNNSPKPVSAEVWQI
jgi:hypothetical protein